MTLRYTVRPLSAAAKLRMTGKGTEISPFRANWSATETLLESELRAVRASDVVLMVNCAEADLRLDGQLRANARLPSPHTALAFKTPRGPLMFACGRFRTWQDNVRGIALGLQALRKIERYGIGQSDEQYEGFRQIAAQAEAVPVPTWAVTLAKHSGMTVRAVMAEPQVAYRVAVTRTHPDKGGDPAAFREVQEARQ